MPRREPYVPQHRGPHAEQPLKKSLRSSVTFAAVAVAATGLAVGSGIVMRGEGPETAVAAPVSVQLSEERSDPDAALRGRADTLGDRVQAVSRSDRRSRVDPVKAAALGEESGGQLTETEDLTNRDPRTIARAMLPAFGFGAGQFSCLDSLYASESGWNVHADNPTSSAYGIPQALPGDKMSAAGPNWEHDAATQIRWGLGYIKARYGDPCSAWGFKQGNNWY